MLGHLAVHQLRNLEPLAWELTPGRHLVLGENGAGKTSLLEAVYLLATTRSFRTGQLADVCRHGADGFRVAGDVEGPRRARLELTWHGGDRHRAVDGKRTSLAEHLAVLPVVAWTAADAEVLAGPPGARRRFLDRGVVGVRPAALAALARHRRTLAQKRELLARGGGAALASWNAVLADAAAEVARLRAAYVDDLATALAAVLAGLALDLPEVTLRYRPSPPAALDGAAAVEEAFAAAVERERAAAQPLLGPQRDELLVRWGGRSVRRVASAGERKVLGMALLAAQARVLARRGRPPLVLLDDADAELDRRRLHAAWNAFADASQVLATSSRPAVWDDHTDVTRWRCEAGSITLT